MKFKDVVKAFVKDQFIIKDLTQNKDFAITESTPDNSKHKIVTIDFGRDVFGEDDCRYVNTDLILMVLKEFYGEEYLLKAVKEIKSYTEIKDKSIS